MKSLQPAYKNILLSILLAIVTIVMVAGWQYLQFRDSVKRYGSSVVTLVSNVPLAALESPEARALFLRPAVMNSPSAQLSFVQVFDGNRQIINQYALNPAAIPEVIDGEKQDFEGGIENVAAGIVEFFAPLSDSSGEGAYVRAGFDIGFSAYLANNLYSMVAGLAPSILLVGIFFLFNKNKNPILGQSRLLMQQLLRRVPHNAQALKKESNPEDNIHNLNILVKSTEKYLNSMESQRSTLNTSTKVLAYQKFNSESILRSVPDGVLVLDESGQVTFANQQFLRWYKLSAEDVVGKMPTAWCERAELTGFLRRYSGMLARRAELGAPENSPPGKPGSTLSVTAYPMFSSRDEKHINSTLIVFSDVTTEVMAQKARDEFAAALAHELKTPLHSIGLHAELLMGEDGEDEDNRIDSANFINTEIEHIGELVRNMLNITRIETGSLSINRKLTKIGDLLKNAVDNLSSNAKENGVMVRIEMPDSVEPSYLDKDLLRVAINNLLSNAIKYNKPGGEVIVNLAENENNLVLSVSDTGIGINEEERDKVFEKFYRSEDEEVRNRSGHGLGLSLVREIVELHNGTVTLDSVPGEGSRFTVRLKRITVPLQEAA